MELETCSTKSTAPTNFSFNSDIKLTKPTYNFSPDTTSHCDSNQNQTVSNFNTNKRGRSFSNGECFENTLCESQHIQDPLIESRKRIHIERQHEYDVLPCVTSKYSSSFAGAIFRKLFPKRNKTLDTTTPSPTYNPNYDEKFIPSRSNLPDHNKSSETYPQRYRNYVSYYDPTFCLSRSNRYFGDENNSDKYGNLNSPECQYWRNIERPYNSHPYPRYTYPRYQNLPYRYYSRRSSFIPEIPHMYYKQPNPITESCKTYLKPNTFIPHDENIHISKTSALGGVDLDNPIDNLYGELHDLSPHHHTDYIQVENDDPINDENDPDLPEIDSICITENETALLPPKPSDLDNMVDFSYSKASSELDRSDTISHYTDALSSSSISSQVTPEQLWFKDRVIAIRKLRELNKFKEVSNYQWHSTRILTAESYSTLMPYNVIFGGIEIDLLSEQEKKNLINELQGLFDHTNNSNT